MMTTFRSTLRIALVASAVAAASALAPAPAAAQSIMAVVNGQPVTSHAVNQRKALTRLTARRNPGTREVIDQLIEERLILAEARRRNISVTQAEVDARYADVAKSVKLSVPQLAEVLGKAGTSPESFKDLMRSQIAYRKVLRASFNPRQAVSESDIAAQLASQDKKVEAAYRYTLREIVFVTPGGANASVMNQRRQEALAFRSRVKSCDQGAEFAKGLRNVAVLPPVIRTDSQLPDQLRTELARMQVGQVTAPSQGERGIEMLALCAKQESNDDTATRNQIQLELADEKFQVEARKIARDLRQRAIIEYR